MRFANAMWDETTRLDTVSPAGQLEAAEDDVLPAVPELNMAPRYIKKCAELSSMARTRLTSLDVKQRRRRQLPELCPLADA